MKNFKTFKNSIMEASKMKIERVPVEIKKVGKVFKVFIDGDHLDDYSSEEEAKKMAKEFVKQLKG
jgi:hypothetical protein